MSAYITAELHRKHVEANGGYASKIVYFQNDDGSVNIEFCESCGYATAHCEHIKCAWTEDKQTLLCNLCNGDMT